MQKALDKLNQTPGVVGSFIVGDDGMIVLASLPGAMDQETVGALASGIVNTLSLASARLRQGAMRSAAVETGTHKLFLSPTRAGYLATIATAEANLGLLRIEMDSTVRALNALM